MHPGLASVAGARRVLVLGGGDGLAVREILKYPQVDRSHAGGSRSGDDAAVLDQPAPDPAERAGAAVAESAGSSTPTRFCGSIRRMTSSTSSSSISPTRRTTRSGKLYTTVFFAALGHHLSERGAFVVQSTSPMFARQSFWCIEETIKQAGFQTFPYHAYVPSFGEWGFVLASRRAFTPPTVLPDGLRFLAVANLATLFEFPSDMARVSMPANRLNDQILVRTLEAEWRKSLADAPQPEREAFSRAFLERDGFRRAFLEREGLQPSGTRHEVHASGILRVWRSRARRPVDQGRSAGRGRIRERRGGTRPHAS